MSGGTAKAASANVLAGAVICGLGAFFLWGAVDIDRQVGALGGPHVFPLAASVALILLGAGIMISAFIRGDEKPVLQNKQRILAFAIPLAGLVYVWLIGAVGYLPATIIVAPAVFYFFSDKGLKGTVLPGIVSAIAIYVVFFQALGVYDPPGSVFSWRDLFGG